MKNFEIFDLKKITDRSSKWANFLPDEALIDLFFLTALDFQGGHDTLGVGWFSEP